MNRLIYPLILLICLCITNDVSAQSEWVLGTELKVGKRPAEIYNLTENEMRQYWIVYCAGWDENNNSIKDEGDEAPSLWYFTVKNAIINSFNPWWLEYTLPQKLIELDFQNVQLPVRFGKDNQKLYIPEPNGLSEVSIEIINQDNMELKAEKQTILPQKVSAISVGRSKSQHSILYLSIRDEVENVGYVMIYDKNTNEFIDTIQAYPKVQMTYSEGYNSLFILNEKPNESDEARLQEIRLDTIIGGKKHLVMHDIEVTDSPVHLLRRRLNNQQNEIILTCEESNSLKFFDSNYDFTVKILPVIGTGKFAKKTYSYYVHNLYTTLYDGNIVYINNNESIKAFGKAESIGISDFFILVATPYFGNNNLPDTTVKFLSKEPVSVKDELTSKHYNIYPNPVKNILEINLTENETPEFISIYNLYGQKVLENLYKEQIDVSSLRSGVYFLRIGNRNCKFIKE